jgi:hypothetical protein
MTRLKDQFKDMELRGNAKVTNDRVFSMAVHPSPTKDLIFVGDKYGSVGMYVTFIISGISLMTDGTLWDLPLKRSRMKMIPRESRLRRMARMSLKVVYGEYKPTPGTP